MFISLDNILKVLWNRVFNTIKEKTTELEMIIVVYKIFSFDVEFTIDGQFTGFLSCFVLEILNIFLSGLKYLLEVGKGQ